MTKWGSNVQTWEPMGGMVFYSSTKPVVWEMVSISSPTAILPITWPLSSHFNTDVLGSQWKIVLLEPPEANRRQQLWWVCTMKLWRVYQKHAGQHRANLWNLRPTPSPQLAWPDSGKTSCAFLHWIVITKYESREVADVRVLYRYYIVLPGS